MKKNSGAGAGAAKNVSAPQPCTQAILKHETSLYKYFSRVGPLNPGKLRHEFSLTARSVKPKDCGKLLAFVKALPGVVDGKY